MVRESQEVELSAGPSSDEVLLLGAAWAYDPTGRFWWRYWDGTGWTAWASNGGEMQWDPVVSGPDTDELGKLDYMRSYLVGAAARGVLSAAAAAALDADVAAWQQVPVLQPPSAIDLRPVETAPPTAESPSTWAPPEPVIPLGEPEPQPAPPPGPPLRERAGAWLHRSVSALSTELAVHGLADLGALLVFVGLFGFVAFAFGEVRPGLRPVAEILIPATAIVVGAFLRRRGTRTVGEVLMVLGGALVPVVLIASFSDDATPPPDLEGGALVAALVASLLVVAGVEALVVRRSPTSPFRFVVAPTCWLAVAAAGLGIGRPVPSGSDLATPMPAQWALVAVAVTATLALSRALWGGRWARTVAVAAAPALMTAYVLTLLASRREGWEPWPVLVAGAGALVGIELLAARRNRVVVAVAELTVVVVTVSALMQTWNGGWVSAGLAVVLVALSETAHRFEAPRPLVVGGLASAGVSLLVAIDYLSVTPIALVVASAVGWWWAAAQTRWPTTLDRNWSRLLVWVLPVPFAAGLVQATSPSTATFVGACIVASGAATMVAVPQVRRDPWSAWVPGVGLAVVLAAVAQLGRSTWWTFAAALLVAAACAAAPLRRPARLGVAAAGIGAAVAVGVDLLDWALPDLAPGATALAGGAVLAASVALRARALGRSVWATAAAGAGTVQVVAVAQWWGSGSRYPSGLLVVGGLAATALGLGVAAKPSRWPWTRHGAAVVAATSALLLAPTLDASLEVVTAAAAAAGVLAALTRASLRPFGRLTEWFQPLTELTVVALVAAVAASADAGPGWTALALVAVAAACALHSIAAQDFWRVLFQAGTAVGSAGAWIALGDWQGWSGTTWVGASAVLGAVVLTGTAVAAWSPRLPRDWVVVSGSSGLVAVLASTAGLYGEGIDRGAAGPWVAGALAVAALVAAALVRPTGWDGWRVVAAVLGVGSVAVLLDAVGADATQILAAAVTVGLLGTAVVVGVSLLGRGRRWALPAEGIAVAGLVGAAGAGPAVGSDGVALFLLLLGAELLAAGTVRRHPVLLYLAPFALCASWLVFASEIFERGPTWFTVPAGATVLVTVELARQQRRQGGLTPSNRLLVAVEAIGMLLLVVAPLVQIVQVGPLHVVESVLLGAALALWGVLTRVRRRFLAGAGTVAAAMVLLVVVPMLDLARRASGPLVWLVVAGIGFVAIVIATFVERHRRGPGAGPSRLRDATEGWE